MRIKITPLLGALLAVLALGALVSSASAEGTCKTGLCIEGKQDQVGKTPFALTQKAGSDAVINIDYGSAVVSCETIKTKEGEIESTEASAKFAYKLHMENCKTTTKGYTGEPCRMSEANTENLDATFDSTEKLTVAGNGLGPAYNFMEAKLGNGTHEACPAALEGSYITHGSVECTIKQAQVETVSKEVACALAGSHLETRGGQYPLQLGAGEGTIALTETHKGQKFSMTAH